ncbi:DNA-binding transcriptional activator PunR [Shewanella algae]|uniref:DNA-binding transcriptional activator PunR n=1 Tax=Shewanella algae TaxID=38313 RepID=UPI000BB5F4F3|nr:DNA-binding transcriptional activator PunR [Shewanella algae]MBO2565252.1 LysR family transcriptional regulator [Shewanella algae]MBO2582357.1 LysR family transcriptional regulator [Shewanella algae]MBO2590980.1 LysR family transcriptional regulator [Shewanella algae]MBO2620357.1 LysR family transcriptional regulator [Shewanella algae]MBO2645554.1 LysR family transcriptional regulator [Shewanella algae]
MLSEQSLQLIDIVSHLGSFTAAANKLHKVPSAVSYAIKQIEEELGVVLFERHHRSVSLTPAGAHFVREARIMLKQLDDLKRETQRVANGWQPTLSIALDNIVRADRISVLIADFYRHFTDVELIIRIEVFNGVWEALSTGRSDVAIGATTAIPVGGAYHHRDMGDIEWAFLVSKSHPLAAIDRPLEDEELRPFPSICLDDTSREIPKRHTWLLDNQRRLVVPDWIRAINCFREGLGIGYMPVHLASPFIRAGALVEKQLATPLAASSCCLAWNANKMSPALKWVLDYLGDTEKLHREWLA